MCEVPRGVGFIGTESDGGDQGQEREGEGVLVHGGFRLQNGKVLEIGCTTMWIYLILLN